MKSYKYVFWLRKEAAKYKGLAPISEIRRSKGPQSKQSLQHNMPHLLLRVVQRVINIFMFSLWNGTVSKEIHISTLLYYTLSYKAGLYLKHHHFCHGKTDHMKFAITSFSSWQYYNIFSLDKFVWKLDRLPHGLTFCFVIQFRRMGWLSKNSLDEWDQWTPTMVNFTYNW